MLAGGKDRYSYVIEKSRLKERHKRLYAGNLDRKKMIPTSDIFQFPTHFKHTFREDTMITKLPMHA